MDIHSIKALVNEEPSLRSGEFGLLVAICLSALEGLNSRDPAEVNLSMGYFQDEHGLFAVFCHAAGNCYPSVAGKSILGLLS